MFIKMKILGIFILGVLVVQTLGNKGPHRSSGPQGFPRGGPSPQKREEAEINEKGSGWGSNGWGWNGPPSYQTFSCADPNTIGSPNYDADFFSRTRLWYRTGNIIFGYSLTARIFLGRNVASQDELNQMCPALAFSFVDPPLRNFGYGRTFQQTCSAGTTTVECPINTDPSTYDAALGVDVFSEYVSPVEYAVATDNSTYLVSYICYDGLYGNLKLLTTRPYASPEAVAAFLAATHQFGIPQSQLQLLQCNSPYQGPYPAPFQNYPNGNGWSNNSTGWRQAPSNGWNSNPQPSGWNSPSSGWSGNNNGWGGHSTLAEKQSDLKEESVKLAVEKPKA